MRLIAAAGAGLVAVLVPLLLIGLVIGGVAVSTAASATQSAAGVDRTKVPPLAAELLPHITTLTAASCPELPPLWVIAHVDAESSWNPAAFSTDSNGGAAGLYQLNQANWTAAGGHSWDGTPPSPTADILQPTQHLDLAIPWICTNLRAATTHLAAAGAPTDPLDAMLVCHIAGCGRVTRSTTGIPTAGEADCNSTCANRIRAYIDRVHANLVRFAAAPTAVPIRDLPAPRPVAGVDSGCTEDDPTSNGCLTLPTRHVLQRIYAVFGPPGPGAPIRSVGCWDEHAWNPSSDHPRGRACDLFPAAAGGFPTGADLANGWRLASWLRAHADLLRIDYLIWQGRIWSPGHEDQDGWGRPYTGGGIYDPDEATGGHFDHIHVSVR